MHQRLEAETDIYLIRPAETDVNKDGDTIGRVDAKLTPHGMAQIALLNSYLLQHGQIPNPKRVFVSDMPRAITTAHALAEGLGVQPNRITQDPRLREIGRGAWEGLPRGATHTQSLTREMAFMDMDHRAPGGGESMSDVAHRMLCWLKDLNIRTGCRLEATPSIIAITHGVAIKSLLQRIFNFDPAYAWLIRIDNTSITKVRSTGLGWQLEYVNATPHLNQPL